MLKAKVTGRQKPPQQSGVVYLRPADQASAAPAPMHGGRGLDFINATQPVATGTAAYHVGPNIFACSIYHYELRLKVDC